MGAAVRSASAAAPPLPAALVRYAAPPDAPLLVHGDELARRDDADPSKVPLPPPSNIWSVRHRDLVERSTTLAGTVMDVIERMRAAGSDVRIFSYTLTTSRADERDDLPDDAFHDIEFSLPVPAAAARAAVRLLSMNPTPAAPATCPLETLPLDILEQVLLNENDPLAPVERVASLSPGMQVRVAQCVAANPDFWRTYTTRCFPHITCLPAVLSAYARSGRIDERRAWRLCAGLLLAEMSHVSVWPDDDWYASSVRTRLYAADDAGVALNGADAPDVDVIGSTFAPLALASGGGGALANTCSVALRPREIRLTVDSFMIARPHWLSLGTTHGLIAADTYGFMTITKRTRQLIPASASPSGRAVDREDVTVSVWPHRVANADADRIFAGDGRAFLPGLGPLPAAMAARVLSFSLSDHRNAFLVMRGDDTMAAMLDRATAGAANVTVHFQMEREDKTCTVRRTDSIMRQYLADVFTDTMHDGTLYYRQLRIQYV